MSQLWVFLALAFSIFIAIFAVQNNQTVPVSFLMLGPAQLAVSVLVLISAAAGAGVMLLLGIGREVKIRWRQRQLGQQLKQSQARVTELEAQRALAAPAAPPSDEPGFVEEEEVTPSPRTAL